MRADSLATVQVNVRHGAVPVAGALVRLLEATPALAAQTDDSGRAMLRARAGTYTLLTTRLGFRPDSLRLMLGTPVDTTISVDLVPHETELETVVVTATRGERRVEDTPLRVEVIDEEEIAEKVTMTPGDIAMMLNETSGLRVQTTNPSLGGASVRVQGLSGRYSLILSDGLPLYGGQAGGLGLLQIPPVDLGRVEVIKGMASALYGSSALGGVINLVSRRPGEERESTALVNQTTRGGTDGVFFGSGPLSSQSGYTVLAGAHRQRQNDLDGDGWTDMPGYERLVIRPRLHFANGQGRTAFLTAGFTAEDREGGTLPGRVVPDGSPAGTSFGESLDTRRFDAGGLMRWVLGDSAARDSRSALHGAILTLRGSAVEQRHDHEFGLVRENDRHRTWFGEAALVLPRGSATYVVGAAFEQDGYRSATLPSFDYSFSVPAAFVQADVDPASWLALSVSARMDAHSAFGSVVNPRVSALFRRPTDGLLAGWTSRLSAGTGAFAPTPFTEETEATGLTPLAISPDGWRNGLTFERATGASLDVGGPLESPLGRVELNATAFGSRVTGALQVTDAAGTTADGAGRIQLRNAAAASRTWGGELLARVVHELGEGAGGEEEPASFRLTATYTYLRSTECDPEAQPVSVARGACSRRETPLTPRHAAGVVATLEREEKSRLGLELYYTGRQPLEENPYRAESPPYLIVGLLGERAFATRLGLARAFVNLENLGNVRQTRTDPLRLPSRGQGGRWATDAWTELSGFTMNAGVRLGF